MVTQNRRKHRRAQAKGFAAHVITDVGQTPCLVENLSSGGLFIRTARLMPVGLAVSINVVRPGMRKSLRLSGRIANSIPARTLNGRVIPPGMGIAFDKLLGEASEHLTKLLKDLGVDPAEGPDGAPPPKPPRQGEAAPESARLQVQIRGVLMELGEAQLKLDSNEKELLHLRAENEKLRAQIRERDERLAKVRPAPHHR
jgi:Tfp pilus assembly protein PilZ